MAGPTEYCFLPIIFGLLLRRNQFSMQHAPPFDATKPRSNGLSALAGGPKADFRASRSIQQVGLEADLRQCRPLRRLGLACADMNGPNRTLTGPCCRPGAARQRRHSPQMQNPWVGELTHRGQSDLDCADLRQSDHNCQSLSIQWSGTMPFSGEVFH